MSITSFFIALLYSSIKMARGAGGIGGSGVYGGVGLGTVVQCKSDDTTFYCSFMKFANMIIMAFVLLAVLYFGFSFIKNAFFRNRSGGGKVR